MCDTLCAAPQSTFEREMLFAKNSDRQRNEAQGIELIPAADHPAGTTVACTYIDIPQAPRTHAVLLSRPYWIWGAEMGANEHGVVAGNETVYSRSAAPESPALIGMDLVRLALERAHTATEALEVMTALLERHGQGGDCGHMTSFHYNNGFMIADANEAYVLETLGREWLVEKVCDIRTISNGYTIGTRVDRRSTGLDDMIRAAGWTEAGESVDYAEVLADPAPRADLTGRQRCARSTSLLRAHRNELRVGHLMAILRDHGPDPERQWTPHGDMPRSLCMHAGSRPSAGQTTGSLISQIGTRNAVHWITGTAAPCTSIFKPVFLDVPLPCGGTLPTGTFNEQVHWWRHERLHREALMGNFAAFLATISSERDALEASFVARIESVRHHGTASERGRVVAECWREAVEMEERWQTELRSRSVQAVADVGYRAAWRRMNRIASLEDPEW